MEESAIYQAIIARGEAKGRIEEAKRNLLRMGAKRFGLPGGAILSMMEALPSAEQAEGLLERMLDVSSWDELMAVDGS